jgi:hypothetical protein
MWYILTVTDTAIPTQGTETVHTKKGLNDYNPLMKSTEYSCMHYTNEQFLLHTECYIYLLADFQLT